MYDSGRKCDFDCVIEGRVGDIRLTWLYRKESLNGQNISGNVIAILEISHINKQS